MAVNHRCKTKKYGDSNSPEGTPMRMLSGGKWLYKCPRCKERWLQTIRQIKDVDSLNKVVVKTFR